MKVVLIGSGNVATHLAFALKAVGINIVQVWSKNFMNAQLLANQVGAEAIADLSSLDQQADFCMLSVKDDAIGTIVSELTSFKGIIVHTSGAVSLSVFESHCEKYGVFYPLQTFSKQKRVDFGVVPICIEANASETLSAIHQLAHKISKNVVEVTSEKRKILHLAAVFACNFTNHLYALSSVLLAEQKLDFEMLRPLILETAAKVQHALPFDVQTGPAIRNDEQTLRKHLELLVEKPQVLTIYETLSESIKKTKK
ncbi:MAG: Rossmann-like and DUF2520 domain-containing protein [Bacteroidia bacterium]